ncbi:MAG: hypothetical protein HRU20_28135 [Pseudomonadales bacterium]|nr:hypothetical protein [Pseudomonadales bacterium]
MRKIGIVILASFVIAIIIKLFVVDDAKPDISEVSLQTQGLPWQIQKTEKGFKVFSIELGVSTLAESITLLGSDYELALLARPGESGSVELFFSHFSAGALKGKLILVAELDSVQIAALITQAVKVQYLETGAKKYRLSLKRQKALMPIPVKAITFVPVARLTEEMVLSRFGQPQSTKQMDEKVKHYFYPDKGVLVIINSAGKDFVEYSLNKH